MNMISFSCILLLYYSCQHMNKCHSLLLFATQIFVTYTEYDCMNSLNYSKSLTASIMPALWNPLIITSCHSFVSSTASIIHFAPNGFMIKRLRSADLISDLPWVLCDISCIPRLKLLLSVSLLPPLHDFISLFADSHFPPPEMQEFLHHLVSSSSACGSERVNKVILDIAAGRSVTDSLEQMNILQVVSPCLFNLVNSVDVLQELWMNATLEQTCLLPLHQMYVCCPDRKSVV